jgi:predicted nucleotidyltransferase
MDKKNKGIKTMDKRQAINIASIYVKEVKSKYDLKKAILFGSFAKESDNNDSDIDIALVFKNVGDIFDMQIELMKLRRNVDLRIEPHPFDEEDFDTYNPVAREILKHGIEI